MIKDTNHLGSSSDDRLDEERNPVEILAEEFAERIRSGESPGIQEYVAKYPELATQIQAVFPSIAKIEKVGQQHSTEASDQWTTSSPERIGDFKIVRKLGQGGMGIVYEALQISLQRHVALKIISPSISNSPKQLERFKREAATVARLHHTNIVPVFGSGEENGIHYYAMQLIDGIPLNHAVQSLRTTNSYAFDSTVTLEIDMERTREKVLSESLIARFAATEGNKNVPSTQYDDGEDSSARKNPDPKQSATESPNSSGLKSNRSTESKLVTARQKTKFLHRVCECVADIADALDYAHEQGIMHRDIKPSNLIMDRQGTVWVTDFGLAKLEENDVLTKTGDMVGTMRYMAPEQFIGEGDTRSDICSLGLTMFELLTLEPAYTETRSAPLIRLKTELPPPSPRKIDPDIPLDLDTIVCKACDTDPRNRYKTAGQMRDDLLAYIEGRPISARRIGPLEQFWRWSRRNPTVASLSGLSILLLLSVAILTLIGNQRIREALRQKEIEFLRAEAGESDAQNALAEARSQRTLAETNFSNAINAFEQIMENISSRGIPQGIAVEGDNEEVRSFETTLTNSDVEVLETLLDFFAEFSQQNKADLSYQSARAQQRVGDILQRLGRLAEAEDGYVAALTSFSKLNSSKLTDRENVFTQMRIMNELAYCASRRGDFEMAEQRLNDCRDYYDRTQIHSPEIKLEHARTLNIFTSMFTRVGYVVSRQALGTQKNQSKNNPNFSRKPDRKPTKRNNTNNRQRLWLNLNELFAEKKTLVRRANDKALRILENLLKDDPDNSKVLLELSRTYQDRVRIHRYAKDQRAVVMAFDKAVKILETLVSKHPSNPAYKFELADLHCNLDRSNRIATGSNVAIKVARDLTEEWPNVSEYEALYANALARSTLRRINSPNSLKRLEEAVEIYRKLIDKYPAHYVYKINFSQYQTVLAAQIALNGDKSTAETLFDEAETILKSISAENESDEFVSRIVKEIVSTRKSALNRTEEK